MDDYKNYIVIGLKYDFNTEDEVKDFLSRNPSYLFRLKAIYKVKKLNINHFV